MYRNLVIFLLISLSGLSTHVYGEDKFTVVDDNDQEIFAVGSTGAVAIKSTSSEVPLLVQSEETGHLGTFFRKGGNDAEIQIGEETAVHKAAVIGFNKTGKYYYMSVYGLGYNRLVFNYNGYLGVGTTSPSHPLQMASGACATSGGVWTNASSREYKTDIRQLTAEKAMDALTQLKPVEFAYMADREEKHVGFIAEDAPDLVATKDRKGMSPMDVVAVLTKVVQEQNKTITELEKKLAELEKMLQPGRISTN